MGETAPAHDDGIVGAGAQGGRGTAAVAAHGSDEVVVVGHDDRAEARQGRAGGCQPRYRLERVHDVPAGEQGGHLTAGAGGRHEHARRRRRQGRVVPVALPVEQAALGRIGDGGDLVQTHGQLVELSRGEGRGEERGDGGSGRAVAAPAGRPAPRRGDGDRGDQTIAQATPSRRRGAAHESEVERVLQVAGVLLFDHEDVLEGTAQPILLQHLGLADALPVPGDGVELALQVLLEHHLGVL